MDISKTNLLIGAVSLVALGTLLGRTLWGDGLASSDSSPTTVLMAPAADNKTEIAYRRNGFGDRIMSPQRREAFSACYNDYLKRNGIEESAGGQQIVPAGKDLSKFEGKVTYIFHVAENGEKLSHEIVDSQINDNTFLGCVEVALRGVRFLPPPLGINRFLAHEFTFKSEQTFKREMEERKNQEPLVLMTATPQK